MKTIHSLNFLFLLSFTCPYVISSKKTLYDDIKNYHQLELPKVTGPESIAFDCNGKGPYVGVSDGRVLKWEGANLGWKEFAIPSIKRERRICDGSTDPRQEELCGRPLGLKFRPITCDLYIADAYFGLLVVGPNGGTAKQLAVSAEGIPFKFTNALDIDDKTGVVYFTDTSTVFQRREFKKVIMTGDKTGRFLKYDPRSKNVTVLLKGLAFPNGVALSNNNSFVLLVELTKIWRFSISCGKVSSTPDVFAELERYPDNIKRNDKGEFWVALNSLREMLQRFANTNYNSAVETAIPWLTQDPVAIKYDEEGKVMKVLDGNYGSTLDSVSEVEEHDGKLYIGSAIKPYVGVIQV